MIAKNGFEKKIFQTTINNKMIEKQYSKQVLFKWFENTCHKIKSKELVLPAKSEKQKKVKRIRRPCHDPAPICKACLKHFQKLIEMKVDRYSGLALRKISLFERYFQVTLDMTFSSLNDIVMVDHREESGQISVVVRSQTR